MIPISIDKFIIDFVNQNPDTNRGSFRSQLVAAVHDKEHGAKCIVCGSLIWAIGTAVAGWNGCFPCIAMESDSSDDYEIDSVCE